MKKLILLCSFLLTLGLSLSAQQNPVQWFAKYKAINATEGEIVITALIDKGWHTYSQRPTDAGPIPTLFTFNNVGNYELVGKTEESDAHEEFVKAFDAKTFVFTNKAEFKQKIKLVGKTDFIIPFKVEFMCCNDMMCLPPKTLDLSVRTK
jgi:hypothetical protein